MPNGFGSATPILPVRKLETSIDFYVKTCGFSVNFVGPRRLASVSRDRRFLSFGRMTFGLRIVSRLSEAAVRLAYPLKTRYPQEEGKKRKQHVRTAERW
jgi:catechol 2,3-dioxygenase-like lactoylglutathione lyase family enzyme